MAGSGQSLDVKKAYEELKKLREEIERVSIDELSNKVFLEDKSLINKIKSVIRGETISYKYALLTQLLAKVVNPNVNALVLQKKAGIKGSFDARSFCKKVVVEFEREYLENVLGGSNDPYVSKPLRREMISPDIVSEIKDKDGWISLYSILKEVEDKGDVEFTRRVLKQVLLEIRKLQVEVWNRTEISISKSPTLADIIDALNRFLAKPSEGARAQAVVYALLRLVNKRIKAFEDIRTAKSTVADKFATKVADIECVAKSGDVKVGISVTEHLDNDKLKEELHKAIQRKIHKLILIAHKVDTSPSIQTEIENYMKQYRIDVIIENLTAFVGMFTTILNDDMRKELLSEIIYVLKELKYLSHIKDWVSILEDMKLAKRKQQNSLAPWMRLE